nr:MAG TPA: hypothetical protein [Caudoviricetes sp.]
MAAASCPAVSGVTSCHPGGTTQQPCSRFFEIPATRWQMHSWHR